MLTIYHQYSWTQGVHIQGYTLFPRQSTRLYSGWESTVHPGPLFGALLIYVVVDIKQYTDKNGIRMREVKGKENN